MTTASRMAIAGLLAVAACGGSDTSSAAGGGTPVNVFTGTLTISSALPGMTATCATTKTVIFRARGVDVRQVTAAGGDCLRFENADAADHKPGTLGTPACPELNAPAPLAPGQSYTTPPLDGPKTCNWQDVLNPPGGGPGDPGY